jgi:hypothetical protein
MSILEDDPPASSIQLNVVVPQCCVTPVVVAETALIGSIDSRFPGRSFVYNGELLQNHRTFASYGIHSSDSIVALASDGSKGAFNRWATMTRDSETFDEMVRSVMDRQLRIENLRIQDIRTLRLESRPRTYSRFLQTFVQQDAAKSNQNRVPTVIPDPAEALRDHPLPVLW